MKCFKALGVFAVAAVQLTSAQLTISVQERLRDQADDRIKEGKSLKELAQAGQILSNLNQVNDYSKVHACRSQAKLTDFELEGKYSENLFYKAEVYRLFECTTMVSVGDEVTELLSNPEATLTSIDDYYFAFMLYKRANHYGAKRSENLIDAISLETTSNWLKNFDESDWSVTRYDEEEEEETEDDLSISTIRMTEMMSSLMSKNGLKSQIENKLQTGLKRFLDEARFVPKVSSSAPAFYVTKNTFVDSTQLNLYLSNTIKEFNKHASIKLQGLKDSSHRNFFLQKASMTRNLEQVYFAMRGLKLTSEVAPFISLTSEAAVSITQIKVRQARAKFQAYDMLGVPSAFNAHVGDTALIMVGDRPIGLDVKDLEFSAATGTFAFNLGELTLGRYWFSIKATHKSGSDFTVFSENSIYVTAGLQHKGLSYEITAEAKPSTDLLGKKAALDTKYPQKVDFSGQQGTDDTFLHVVTNVIYTPESQDPRTKKVIRPAHVYLTLNNDGYKRGQQLTVNAQAVFDEDSGLYVATLDFTNEMDQINGDFAISMVVADSFVEEPSQLERSQTVWDLGRLSVWFREGTRNGNNQRIKERYLPKPEVVSTFAPPGARDKNPLVAYFTVSVLSFVFLIYLRHQVAQKANVKNLDFWGTLLVLNLVAILAILVAFWVQINLIDTLWICVAMAPITLFVFNKGLAGSASCDVPEVARSRDE